MNYIQNDLYIHKSFRRFLVCNRKYFTPEMAAFFHNPEKTLDDPCNRFYKKGKTSTVVKVCIGDYNLVVKRYNIKNLPHGIRRAFMITRAEHSWRNSILLKSIGVLTPEPIGFMDRRFGPFRNRAYFINECLDGTRAVDFFKNGDRKEMIHVARKIKGIFHKLESRKISHGDMKATNIIIQDGEPALVDLDAMRAHTSHSRFRRAHKKDLERFFRNWESDSNASALFEDVFGKHGQP